VPGRLPFVVGEVERRRLFSRRRAAHRRIEFEIIKKPKGDIFLPHEWNDKSIVEIIEKVFKFEQSINPNWDDYWVDLTIRNDVYSEYYNYVVPPPLHRDGKSEFPKEHDGDYSKVFPASHYYLVYDSAPTLFYEIDFSSLGTNPNNSEVYDYLFSLYSFLSDHQERIFDPYKILAVSGYQIHIVNSLARRQLKTFLGWKKRRTFVRIGFSMTRDLDGPKPQPQRAEERIANGWSIKDFFQVIRLEHSRIHSAA